MKTHEVIRQFQNPISFCEDKSYRVAKFQDAELPNLQSKVAEHTVSLNLQCKVTELIVQSCRTYRVAKFTVQSFRTYNTKLPILNYIVANLQYKVAELTESPILHYKVAELTKQSC